MLTFEKVIEQVKQMGRMAAYRTEEISQRGQMALQLIREADDLALIDHKIEVVRDKDAGYRGAAAYQEPIHQGYAAANPPPQATLVAVDGSQIYPDQHGPALYYLTNLGIFTYFHGDTGDLPLQRSDPYLYYKDSELRERNGHGSIIKNTAVNARRDVQELQVLAETCWQYPHPHAPLVGIRDGRLLWWLSMDIPKAGHLESQYFEALKGLHELHQIYQQATQHHVSVLGYIESGDSSFVIRLLHLLTLEDDDINRQELEENTPFEGLTDSWLFSQILQPGERSAVMIQQSPQNKRYKNELGDLFEIAFFYLNVGTYPHPHIARVEIPMWVAQSAQAIDDVQSLLLTQTRITGRYPYVLTRADELAVIRGHDRKQLEDLIKIELIRNHQSVDSSPKLVGKQQARYR